MLVVGEDDKVALRTVTLREPYQQYYIVSSGLKPGERVIVEGIQKARPGMQVKAETKSEAPPQARPDPKAATKPGAPAGASPPAKAPSGG